MTGRPLSGVARLRFPNLTDKNHSVTSPSTGNYNCIAWAYELDNKWMWPRNLDAYWPLAATGLDELTALIQLYAHAGYEECENGEREEGFKKVAIYVNQEGPTHAARQTGTGRWTSKLGKLQDVEHDTLEVLEGELYGKATVFLRKRLV